MRSIIIVLKKKFFIHVYYDFPYYLDELVNHIEYKSVMKLRKKQYSFQIYQLIVSSNVNKDLKT